MFERACRLAFADAAIDEVADCGSMQRTQGELHCSMMIWRGMRSPSSRGRPAHSPPLKRPA